jgi:hypothetical protein
MIFPVPFYLSPVSGVVFVPSAVLSGSFCRGGMFTLLGHMMGSVIDSASILWEHCDSL